MKKTISVILALILILSVFPPSVFAEGFDATATVTAFTKTGLRPFGLKLWRNVHFWWQE